MGVFVVTDNSGAQCWWSPTSVGRSDARSSAGQAGSVTAPPDALLQRFPDHTWSPVTDGLSGALVWRLHGPSELFVKAAGATPHLDSGFDLRAETERTR